MAVRRTHKFAGCPLPDQGQLTSPFELLDEFSVVSLFHRPVLQVAAPGFSEAPSVKYRIARRKDNRARSARAPERSARSDGSAEAGTDLKRKHHHESDSEYRSAPICGLSCRA